MSSPSSRSSLYRLIEAAQLAQKALLAPLVERGLEAGDDAVLFVLDQQSATTEQLSTALGLSGTALDERISRLIERDLVERQTVDQQQFADLALTPRGSRICAGLAENWAVIEDALVGSLNKKQQKQFATTLKQFAVLLRQ